MPTFKIAVNIVAKLQKKGHKAYFAGGWVRDFLMDHPSDDIDIATSASIEDIESLFPKTIPVGRQFGIIVVVEQGHSFEVATFRSDLEYQDGRRPIGFTPASEKEDVQRRDFTINGMFYDPINEKLIDHLEGKKDLKKKIIKAIGNPQQRFTEDRLRMIRAIRYSARFDFEIEPNTFSCILKLRGDLFPSVAIERVWQEIVKMEKYVNFEKAILLLFDTGLLHVIFPSFSLQREILEKRVACFCHFPEKTPTVLYILELFEPFSLAEKINLCKKLKLSKKELGHSTNYHQIQSFFYQFQSASSFEKAHVFANPDYFLNLSIFLAKQADHDKLGLAATLHVEYEKHKTAINRIIQKKPILTSKDLLDEGIAPGEKMGQLLKEAEKIAINNNLVDKEATLQMLKATPFWNK